MGSVVESTPVVMSSTSLITNALSFKSSYDFSNAYRSISTTSCSISITCCSITNAYGQFTTSMDVGNSVYDEDYRLGRRILDDFRPSSYKNLNAISSVQGVAVIW